MNQPVYCLVLAISKENGVEHYDIYDKSVDQKKFEDYLDNLYIANKHDKLAIFMDNLSVHKTTSIKMKLHELGIEPIYNVPYHPDFNPVESCFSKIKNHYKRKKLHILVNDEDVDMRDLVIEAVN